MSKPNCHYCLKPLRPRIAHGERTGDAIMLDRKDSALPYTAENCVPCCPACNYIKGPFLSEREMLLISALRRGDVDLAESLIRGT